jgi:hypothetical protein
MDAVDGTGLNAGVVLDAATGDYVGHCFPPGYDQPGPDRSDPATTSCQLGEAKEGLLFTRLDGAQLSRDVPDALFAVDF